VKDPDLTRKVPVFPKGRIGIVEAMRGAMIQAWAMTGMGKVSVGQ